MKKKWIYHVLKILFLLCLAMPLFGKITQDEQFLTTFTALGYPIYLSQILMIAYLLGLVGIFQSKFPLLKEWAYAGFTFALLGAYLSHFLSGEGFAGTWALVTLAFLLGSYFYGKKLII